jgi:pimeloyl-ACP methyl ester carboxylesterase
MRKLVLLLCASVVLTACSSITIGEQDVLYPKPSVTPQTFDVEGVSLTETYIDITDSVAVNAWHLAQSDPQATVLFFGGNGFYLVQSKGYLQALTRPPVNALLWDYRGYGRSGGSPGVDELKHDALAVYDSLRARPDVSAEQLVVWGHSLGSFLATHVANEREVGGIVLENPATTVDDWVGHLIPWYVRLFLGVDVDPALRGESNLKRVRALEAPLLVVGGAGDNVTNPEMARRLHKAAGSADKTLIVVEDGSHNGLYEKSDVQKAYHALIEQVGQNRPASEEATDERRQEESR